MKNKLLILLIFMLIPYKGFALNNNAKPIYNEANFETTNNQNDETNYKDLIKPLNYIYYQDNKEVCKLSDYSEWTTDNSKLSTCAEHEERVKNKYYYFTNYSPWSVNPQIYDEVQEKVSKLYRTYQKEYEYFTYSAYSKWMEKNNFNYQIYSNIQSLTQYRYRTRTKQYGYYKETKYYLYKLRTPIYRAKKDTHYKEADYCSLLGSGYSKYGINKKGRYIGTYRVNTYKWYSYTSGDYYYEYVSRKKFKKYEIYSKCKKTVTSSYISHYMYYNDGNWTTKSSVYGYSVYDKKEMVSRSHGTTTNPNLSSPYKYTGVNSYSDYGSFSAYSTNYISSTDTRDVQTRTLYRGRYRIFGYTDKFNDSSKIYTGKTKEFNYSHWTTNYDSLNKNLEFESKNITYYRGRNRVYNSNYLLDKTAPYTIKDDSKSIIEYRYKSKRCVKYDKVYYSENGDTANYFQAYKSNVLNKNIGNNYKYDIILDSGQKLSDITDYNTVERIKKLHPSIIAPTIKFMLELQDRGLNVRITQGLRTFEYQNKLYNQGRTTPGNIVTNAKAGYSYHNYGLAVDIVEIVDGKANWNSTNWELFGDIGKKYGFEWGGDWKSFVDKPHFQMDYNYSVRDLLKMYNNDMKDDNGYILL